MEIALPPSRPDATYGALVPFAVGADSHRLGRPRTFNPYEFGTLAHDRFNAGWHASASIAEGEAEDVARETAEDAAGAARD